MSLRIGSRGSPLALAQSQIAFVASIFTTSRRRSVRSLLDGTAS